MDVLINSMGGVLSQCKHISNHHIVHFKYLLILFVSYTSVKLGKKGQEIEDWGCQINCSRLHSWWYSNLAGSRAHLEK